MNVDTKYSTDNYKSPKISIGTLIKYRDMLKFVLDHFKTKTLWKHAFKKFSFVIRYVPD